MAFSRQLTASFDNALKQDQHFLCLEVQTGSIGESLLQKTVERSNTLQNYLLSRDIADPNIRSGAIGFEKKYHISDLNMPEIDELDFILTSKNFEARRLARILSSIKKESHHSEIYSTLTPEIVSPIRFRNWYIQRLRRKKRRSTRLNRKLNVATNGIIPEEYMAQMIGELIPTAQIFPRVNINGSVNIPNASGNLEFILDKEDDLSKELDLIIIAEGDEIYNAMDSLVTSKYRFKDLKSRLLYERTLIDP